MSLYWIHVNYEDLLQSCTDPEVAVVVDDNKTFTLISYDDNPEQHRLPVR